MQKFLNFVKKPLLYISAGLFVAFLAMLIIVSCLPHGKTYTYEVGDLGEVEYSFKGKEVTITEKALGEEDSTKYEYKIEKGELFIKYDTEFEKVAKINAYEITAGEGEYEVTMDCKTNKALRTVSIIGMSVFGVVAIAGVVVLVLDKKGVFNKKEDAPAPAAE